MNVFLAVPERNSAAASVGVLPLVATVRLASRQRVVAGSEAAAPAVRPAAVHLVAMAAVSIVAAAEETIFVPPSALSGSIPRKNQGV